MMLNRSVQQGGFTIIELLVASALGMLVMVVLGGVLLDSVRSADRIHAQLDLNRAAREAFDILALGGRIAGANTDDDIRFDYNFGIRGRSSGFINDPPTRDVPPGWEPPSYFMAVREADDSRMYRIALPPSRPAIAAPLYLERTLQGAAVEPREFSCTATDEPYQGCVSPGTAVVEGFLAQIDVNLTTSDGDPMRTFALRFQHPTWFDRLGVVNSDVTSTYWMGFGMTVNRPVSP